MVAVEVQGACSHESACQVPLQAQSISISSISINSHSSSRSSRLIEAATAGAAAQEAPVAAGGETR